MYFIISSSSNAEASSTVAAAAVVNKSSSVFLPKMFFESFPLPKMSSSVSSLVSCCLLSLWEKKLTGLIEFKENHGFNPEFPGVFSLEKISKNVT